MISFTVTLNDDDHALLQWFTDKTNADAAALQNPEAPRRTATIEQVFDRAVRSVLSARRAEFDQWLTAQRIDKLKRQSPEYIATVDAAIGVSREYPKPTEEAP